MAATVSPWSKPGAWALDAEEHEAELLQQQNDAAAAAAASAAADFPTLSTAVSAGGGKSKKKKGQTLSLAEFTTYGGPKPAEPAAGLTHEDRLALPKGPRERTAEELDRNRLGGGFRNYGDRGGSRGGEWGGQPRGSDRERGGGRDSVRDSGPSRADEADNWASAKKPSIGNGFERRDSRDGRDRGGFFDSQSKADESDSWVANKSFAPPPPAAEARRFGGGRGGFASNGGGADSDFWGKRREESSNGFGSGSGSGSEGGTGRRRLNLQPRTLPVVNNGGGSQGKEAGTAAAVVAKPKGANPFGEARPREEVLAEKGQDWKKIDEQLDSMKIKEAGERAEGGGSSFGKRSFGSGNGRSGSSGGRTETSWRRPGSADADGDAAAAADADDSQSAEKNEDDEPAAEN